MLPPSYSLETHGPSYATEESRAAGQAVSKYQLDYRRGLNANLSELDSLLCKAALKRTTRRPAPVYAIGLRGTFWRCDLDGYGVYDPHKHQWISKHRLGLRAFNRITLAPPDLIGTKDVPMGQRPHGEWRRYVASQFSGGQQVTYEHFLYGTCFIVASDGIHAIIETFDSQEWHTDENGAQTLRPVKGGQRMEVMYDNLTQRPMQIAPAVRNRKCANCGHKYPTYFDDCTSCGTSYAANKTARRTKTTQPTKIDWSGVDLDLLK